MSTPYKNIKLVEMAIENFKGIKSRVINTNAQNVLISGYNETGKSTVMDAFNWLLFNKNAAGDTKFEIRPRGLDWNEIHDIVTIVSATFEVTDGDGGTITFTLRKEQVEDLTKEKRAALKPSDIAPKKNFYFIDNAPYQEKFFNQKVAELLAVESILQLISNPSAFFQKDEKKQRKLLFEACGMIDASNVAGYAQVKEICGAVNTPEQTRDALMKSITIAKKKVDEIPARIDSVSKIIDNTITDESAELARLEIAQIDGEIERLTAKITDAANNTPKLEKPVKPSDEMLKVANSGVYLLSSQINSTEKLIATLKGSEQIIACPNCGANIPIVDNSAEIAHYQSELVKAQKKLEAAQLQQSDEKAKYEAALAEYQKQLAEYEQKRNDTPTDIAEKRSEIMTLRARRDTLRDILQKHETNERVYKQIAELREQAAKVDDEMAAALVKLSIVKDFINRKQTLEMERINGRFKTVEFRLFEQQTNGDTIDVCKAVIRGVSYASQNTASKVQAGVEVANLFAEHFGIFAPIWIDNKESVFDLPETNGQLILLKADRRYKELTVEKNINVGEV